jgi:hypothetical protein
MESDMAVDEKQMVEKWNQRPVFRKPYTQTCETVADFLGGEFSFAVEYVSQRDEEPYIYAVKMQDVEIDFSELPQSLLDDLTEACREDEGADRSGLSP